MAQERSSFRSMKAAALYGLVMVIIDVFITLWLAAPNPGYSHARQFISELGEAGRPCAWLFAVWSVVYGMLFAAFSAGLVRSLGGRPGARPSAVMLFAFAAGNAAGGIFACDPGCAGQTLSAKMHIGAGAVNLVAISLAPFFVCRGMTVIQAWRGYRAFTFIIGCLLCGLSAWLGLCYFVDLTLALVGAVQRALMLVLYSWIAALSVRLWRWEESRPT